MKIVFFLAVVVALACGLSGCTCRQCNLMPEQMLRISECEQAIAAECGLQFSVTTVERASKLYRRHQLGYVGSDSNYHYFRWFIKMVDYPDQPAGIAIGISEYTPDEEFRVCEPRIGGLLFP